MVDERMGTSSTLVGDEASSTGDGSNREPVALSDTLRGVSEEVARDAKHLGNHAVSALGEQAEEIRDEAAAGLAAFSEVLKTASQELSGKRLGFAGDLISQAGSGLEALAQSLQGKSPPEILAGIRSFGRENPIGFIAGSVLAGFALGRVAAATSAATTAPPAETDDGEIFSGEAWGEDFPNER